MPSATSTNMDSRYLISNFVPTVTVQDNDNINQNPQLEVFSSANIKTRKLINSVAKYRFYHEKIPVVARRQLGNTSCWWMIMLANGQNHALTVQSGELLDLPDIDALRNALLVQSNNTSRTPRFTVI